MDFSVGSETAFKARFQFSLSSSHLLKTHWIYFVMFKNAWKLNPAFALPHRNQALSNKWPSSEEDAGAKKQGNGQQGHRERKKKIQQNSRLRKEKEGWRWFPSEDGDYITVPQQDGEVKDGGNLSKPCFPTRAAVLGAHFSHTKQ